MSTMQAAVVDVFGEDLNVKDVEVPEPGPGQALVKLIASGVCHTDLHAKDGDWPVKPEPPFIPGHEGVGVVEKLGEGVTELAVGDMVGNAWLASACGTCEHCRNGWETLCEEQTNGGYSVNGSFGSTCSSTPRSPLASPRARTPTRSLPCCAPASPCTKV